MSIRSAVSNSLPLRMPTKAGPFVDADFASAPYNASIVGLDTANNLVYAKDGTGVYRPIPLGFGTGAFNVRDYAATMNGVADDRAALLAAINAVVLAGGGNVFLPPGTLAFTGGIDVPTGVNLVGSGNGYIGSATTLKCLDAAAQIRFGATGTASVGGRSGGFRIDGNNLATQPLFLGRTVQRSFADIDVRNAAAGGVAVLLQETQNCFFYGLTVVDCRGDHLMLTAGASGNRFFGFESSGAGITASGGYGGAAPVHVRFTCIGAAPSPLVAWPVNNTFHGGIIERDGGNLASLIHHGAGADNAFRDVVLSLSGIGRATPLVKMAVDDAVNGNMSIRHRFYACYFQGSGANVFTTVFDVASSSLISVILDGRNVALNALYTFLLRGTQGRVYALDGIDTASVSATLDPASVGTLDNQVFNDIPFATRQHRANATDEVFRMYLDAESGAGWRWRLAADGKQTWGDGTNFAGDTNLYRLAANQLRTDDTLIGNDGVATKTKAGTPTDADFATAPPVGTIVVDTTANKIWVRTAAATWKGVVVA